MQKFLFKNNKFTVCQTHMGFLNKNQSQIIKKHKTYNETNTPTDIPTKRHNVQLTKQYNVK